MLLELLHSMQRERGGGGSFSYVSTLRCLNSKILESSKRSSGVIEIERKPKIKHSNEIQNSIHQSYNYKRIHTYVCVYVYE